MIQHLLDKKVQAYIRAQKDADIHELLLKKVPFPALSVQDIVAQIQGRRIAQRKFPFLLQEGIVFPPHLNMEQASSQLIAMYKASFLKGETYIDLTCGLGVDAFFMSKGFDRVTLVEQNATLLQIVAHNWKVLGREAIFEHKTIDDFLKTNTQVFDIVYIDPARRDNLLNKKFLLEDLSPNVCAMQDIFRTLGKKVVIKLSPLFDITQVLQQLKGVERINIISVKNEVKELLVELSGSALTCENPMIVCTNILSETQQRTLQFTYNEIKNAASPHYTFAKPYIYIPDNDVLKSGAFNWLAQHYVLDKLHVNTHIYTSETPIEYFAGRMMKMKRIEAKSIKQNTKYHIISKNYPLSVEEIKKKYKIKEGGNQYILFTKEVNGYCILLQD